MIDYENIRSSNRHNYDQNQDHIQAYQEQDERQMSPAHPENSAVCEDVASQNSSELQFEGGGLLLDTETDPDQAHP